MQLEKIKKENFHLSGAGEVALIYSYGPIFGSFKTVNDDCLACFTNNVGYIYAGEKGLVRLKESVKNSSYLDLKKEIDEWSEKWGSHEEEFYDIAVSENGNWRENWKRVNDLSNELWTEAYKAEVFDNFSDEIEEFLISELKNVDLDPEILNELVLPSMPTKVQEALINREIVKLGKYKQEDFIRDYWYMHGNWGGGRILNEEILEKDLKEKSEDLDFKHRKEIHELAESKLSEETLNLIKILRMFALWRDERKEYMQRMCLAFGTIVKQAAFDLGVDKKAIEYAMYKEIDLIKENEDSFLNRSKKSVLVFEKNALEGIVLVDDEADLIIKEFKNVDVKEIKGTTACKGKASGKVKVIMKTDQFDQFEEGDVLVTGMTRPEFVPLMKMASAVVTDEGGLTSHAAIVSRELNIPCIVGTKNSTQTLQSGIEVEVDADNGLVNILND